MRQPVNLAVLRYSVVLALASGCAGSTHPPLGKAVETAPGRVSDAPEAALSSDPYAFPPSDPYAFPPEDPAALLAVLYFAFDSSALPRGADAILAPLAGLSWTGQLQLTGHADPVGTEEYNLGLGLRRARAVARRLISLGASPGALVVATYGESRPLTTHALSRRVEVEVGP